MSDDPKPEWNPYYSMPLEEKEKLRINWTAATKILQETPEYKAALAATEYGIIGFIQSDELSALKKTPEYKAEQEAYRKWNRTRIMLRPLRKKDNE